MQPLHLSLLFWQVWIGLFFPGLFFKGQAYRICGCLWLELLSHHSTLFPWVTCYHVLWDLCISLGPPHCVLGLGGGAVRTSVEHRAGAKSKKSQFSKSLWPVWEDLVWFLLHIQGHVPYGCLAAAQYFFLELGCKCTHVCRHVSRHICTACRRPYRQEHTWTHACDNVCLCLYMHMYIKICACVLIYVSVCMHLCCRYMWYAHICMCLLMVICKCICEYVCPCTCVWYVWCIYLCTWFECV